MCAGQHRRCDGAGGDLPRSRGATLVERGPGTWRRLVTVLAVMVRGQATSEIWLQHAGGWAATRPRHLVILYYINPLHQVITRSCIDNQYTDCTACSGSDCHALPGRLGGLMGLAGFCQPGNIP